MGKDIEIRDIDKLSYSNTIESYNKYVRPTYIDEEFDEILKKMDYKIAEFTYCEDFAIKMIKEDIKPEIISRVTRFSLNHVKELINMVNKND